MKIPFSKYHGAGNDFILLDNRNGDYSSLNTSQVSFLCNRHFGIGADGLILLEGSAAGDFYMKYFNSDGRISSMCGNGGRCVTAFANHLHIIPEKAVFEAIDGAHEAYIIGHQPTIVRLKMQEVKGYEVTGDDIILDTGSPHYVKFVEDAGKVNVVAEGRKIRYSDRFSKEGTNVNFVQVTSHGLIVRSYERGVEDETLSCGTGVTAAVLAAALSGKLGPDKRVCEVSTPGGPLSVYFEPQPDGFREIWLEGGAAYVYSGEIEI